MLVIRPVRFLGAVFHASDSTNFLTNERDYLRREIERLQDEVIRERVERVNYEEMFHRALGISAPVKESRTEAELRPVQGRRTWSNIKTEYEEKKIKEANERRRRSSENTVRGSEKSTP